LPLLDVIICIWSPIDLPTIYFIGNMLESPMNLSMK
jgi:hypothetical protein